MKLIFTSPAGSQTTVNFNSDFDRVTERYEGVAEEVEIPQSKRIRQINFGARWFAKYLRSHADGDTRFYESLRTHFAKSVKVEAEGCRHLDGARFEVILFNPSWDWNGQWQNVINEQSFSFELKSASLLAAVEDPKTVSIIIGASTLTLSGVEIHEELKENRITATGTDGVDYEKVKWVKAHLRVIMPETEGNYPNVVRNILRKRLEGGTMKLQASFSDYFTVANDLAVTFDEDAVLKKVYNYHLATAAYELSFKSAPLSAEQIYTE